MQTLHMECSDEFAELVVSIAEYSGLDIGDVLLAASLHGIGRVCTTYVGTQMLKDVMREYKRMLSLHGCDALLYGLVKLSEAELPF